MKKTHYAWSICLGCALLMFCSNGIVFNIFSVFQPYLIRFFHLTNTQSSSLITIRTVSSLCAVWLCGAYYRIFSLRKGMFLAGLISTVGFFLFAAAGSFPALAAAILLCGAGYGLGTTVPIAMMIGRWFDKSRGLAMSVCSIAASAALVGFPSAVTYMIERQGIRFSFTVIAAAALLLSVCGFLLLRNDPAELGLQPYGAGEAASEGTSSGPRRKAAKEGNGSETGLQLPDWILLGTAVVLLGCVSHSGYAHFSVYFNSLGLRPEMIALGLSSYGAALLCGKLSFGYLADRLGCYRCNWIYGAVMIAGFGGLCLASDMPPLLLASAAAAGLGMAIANVGVVIWAWDLSSPRQQDAAVRRLQLLMNIGGLSFSTVPGILADRFGGSYIPAFMILTVFCIVLILAVQAEYLRKKKTRTGY